MKALPFPCPKCGRRTFIPNTVRCHTGKRRYRECQVGHGFTTFQPFGGEEVVVHLLNREPKPDPVKLPKPARVTTIRPGLTEIEPGNPPKFAGPWDEQMHREWLAGLVGQVQRT